MRKHKGDERKQTLDTKIYPVVRLGTKPLLLHIVEAFYQEYRFSAIKSLPRLCLPCHQSLQVTTVTLAPGSTKEHLNGGWASPRPPHKDVDAAPHQYGGSLTLPVSHQDSKGKSHIVQVLVHSRTTTQGSNTLLSHSLKS